jgi:hypothetical protein
LSIGRAFAEARGVLDPEGPFAFVAVGPAGAPGEMRPLVVDTWLMHGDRARRRYRGASRGYVFVKREPDIVMRRTR